MMNSARRRFLQGLASTAAYMAFPAIGAAPGGRVRFMALGQAAIQFDVREHPYPGFAPLAALLRQGDIVFTDLETPISGPESEKATRDTIFAKAAEPVVLDCLKDLSINLLALSNNHAWDFGTGGVLATRNAVRDRGFAYAGTGDNLAQATAAGYRKTASGASVALVSMASGQIREGGAATATRAGVNEVRLEKSGELNAEDTARNLASIREAARTTPNVFVYQHDHYWEKDFAVTPAWKRAWAKQCIDAGACAFVSHGAPLLHGIELYRGRPIFYDLGSLIFHTKTKVGYYRPEVWESAVADCVFEDGRLVSLELTPVVLNESGADKDAHYETRGRPTIANGVDAKRILDRLQAMSSTGGVRITQVGNVGRVAV